MLNMLDKKSLFYCWMQHGESHNEQRYKQCTRSWPELLCIKLGVKFIPQIIRSGLIIQICLNVLIINNYIFLKEKGHGLASVQYLHVSRPVVEIIC